MPEIPAFDPDDWFGKPGNPEIPDVTVSDEIGGHVYSLEFVDVECEEGADPAVVAQYQSIADMMNQMLESGQTTSMQISNDGTFTGTSGDVMYWAYADENNKTFAY